ncbi:TetR/AcrR family transcriptional regulator [Streptomyces verrucosisporus]|uniref:TetR/AcrR family transcriptional regulator n=1 Tax=Streptomyces verrucosisporus TaxID=1695161 RepID=UPI0019D306D8|nr:TetR/AcrR family transcriptional regulator [Streptomyces verrucosisporus]MBN3928863.1 TetR/AcrR family transcriptional regulator [Streptomyces verrucosisporus]
MGRPRAFDEDQAVRTAAELFAGHGYEGTSVDDLVTALGVHRGSLYKVFGSKRGLYLATLRHHLDRHVLPFAAELATARDLESALVPAAEAFDGGPAAGLLLLAQAERAHRDPEVAALTEEGFAALERALARVLAASGGPDAEAGPDLAAVLGAAVLGLRLRSRTAGVVPKAARALAACAVPPPAGTASRPADLPTGE